MDINEIIKAALTEKLEALKQRPQRSGKITALKAQVKAINKEIERLEALEENDTKQKIQTYLDGLNNNS